MSKKEKEKYRCNLLPYERTDCLSIQDANQHSGWGITAFDLPKTWKHTQGEGVVIAVLDTGCDLDHPDLKDNLIQGKNFVNENSAPDDDNGHGCVSPNTLICTSYSGIDEIESLYNKLDCEEKCIKNKDGCYSVKDISNLNIKTYSLDSENFKTVISNVNCIQRLPIKGQIVHVELEGNICFDLTPWHPAYLLKHNKVIRKRADEICLGDNFIFPDSECDFGQPQFCNLCERFVCETCGHQPRHWIGETPSKCKKCKNKSWNIVVKQIEITSEIAWLCGIVMTDGYVHQGANRFEVSSNTIEILEKVKRISANIGFNSKIEKNRILVYGKDAVELMLSLGVSNTNKSLTQTLPKWVGLSKKSVIYGFVAGVVDGDGCISKSNTKNRITTASLQFANEFCMLLNTIGISSSVSKPNFDKRNRKIHSNFPVYKINHTALLNEIVFHLAHPKKILRSKIEIKYKRRTRRVKSVSTKKYDGYFYDFTVENYHNYLANGHFVSNTHVSGILVAQNNDIGMVGVCPKAKVMPIKVLNKKGAGDLLQVAKGIVWAADNGADIITMSLGAPMKVQQVRKAIQYAASKSVPTFVAAGNAGNTKELFYPANYPESISIGAIDENFNRAKFSNTGMNLDFMAPGVDIFSTVPDNWYATLSGTSMACPFAVGVAALVLSYVKHGKSSLVLKTVDDYRNVLKKYTVNTLNSSSKFYQGFGIIDPRKMMENFESHSTQP